MHIDIQRCTCMQVKTRRCTDTHSFFTHAVPQIYLHICIFAYLHLCIFAYLQICRYALWLTGMHLQRNRTGAYLLPLGERSPAQGICETAFLKHPRRFWLQKGHEAWLTQVFPSFSRQFFSPNLLFRCVHLLRVLPSDLSSCLGFLRQLRQKKWGDWV